MPGADRRESEYGSERQGSWGDPSRNKGARRHHFPLSPPNINNTHLQEPARHQQSLPNLLAPNPLPAGFSGSTLPSHTCCSPGTTSTLPRRLLQTLSTPISPNPHILWDLSSSGGRGRSHFTSTPLHTLFKHAPPLLGTK